MNKLREDAFKSPVYHIAIIVLLGMGLVSLPIERLFNLFISDTLKARLIGGATLRFILSGIAIYAIYKYGFSKLFKSHNGIFPFIMCFPALVVVINNFPIRSVIGGNAVFHSDAIDVLLYVSYCISVGLFEELLFCGLVFPLVIYAVRDNNYSVVLSTVITSTIFAFSHLLNLFSGASVGTTLLQIGYSFLIGAMCIICKCVTRNVYTAIVLHVIYDVGGLLFSNSVGLASGNQWDVSTVIFTIIIGVLTTVYMIYMAFKIYQVEVQKLYFEEEIKFKKG